MTSDGTGKARTYTALYRRGDSLLPYQSAGSNEHIIYRNDKYIQLLQYIIKIIK